MNDLLDQANEPEPTGARPSVGALPGDLLSQGSGRQQPLDLGDPEPHAPARPEPATERAAGADEFEGRFQALPLSQLVLPDDTPVDPLDGHPDLIEPEPLRDPDPLVLAMDDEDATLPGMVPRMRPPILQTPEEKEAQLRVILDEDLEATSDSSHIVLDFGPFGALEQHLRRAVKDTASDEIAAALIHHARQALHTVVIAWPSLMEPERNEAGLKARYDCLTTFKEQLATRVSPMLTKIGELGLDLSPVQNALMRVVDDEQTRLKLKEGRLVAPTLGNNVVAKLADIKDGLAKKFSGRAELTADVRQRRNELITRALDNLQEVSVELVSNAGDDQWERAEGPMAARVARELVDEICGLTKGVEDQVDYKVLNRRLGECNRNMDEAAKNVADEEHKGRLQKLVEHITAAIQAITSAVSKVLGLGNKAAEPARPAPV